MNVFMFSVVAGFGIGIGQYVAAAAPAVIAKSGKAAGTALKAGYKAGVSAGRTVAAGTGNLAMGAANLAAGAARKISAKKAPKTQNSNVPQN